MAATHKTQGRDVEVRKNSSNARLLGNRDQRTDKRCSRARSCTKIALVNSTRVVVSNTGAIMALKVACGHVVILVPMPGAGMVLVPARLWGLHLHLHTRRRALHGNRQRPPNGQQQGKQQQEAKAKKWHGG